MENGGSAFPIIDTSGWVKLEDPGMTLRDYFASKAMQGLLADPNMTCSVDSIAEQAYKYADAMLKAKAGV